MNHDRNKETFWGDGAQKTKVTGKDTCHYAKQKQRVSLLVRQESQVGPEPILKQTRSSCKIKLQIFSYPESCGEYSTRQMFTKAYCIKQELYSLVFGNICVFGITLLPFPLQILYSLLFLFVSALLPGLMHMYSALHSFQCKICGQH